MSLIVYIEGNIGAGKSTLMARLKNVYDQDKSLVMTEPVSNWPSLKLFYENKRKYALQLQREVLTSFHDRETLCAPRQLYVFERSLFSAMNIFSELNCNEDEMKCLQPMYEKMGRVQTLDKDAQVLYIYVRTTAEICLERIKMRGKPTDGYITLDYLKVLERKHDDKFIGRPDTCVVYDDGKSVDMVFRKVKQIIDLKNFIDCEANVAEKL